MSEAPSLIEQTKAADLFAPAPEETPFAGEPPVQPQAVSQDPKILDKATRVAALASTDPKEPDIFGQMQANIDNTRDLIERYGDMSFRMEAAAKSQLEEVNAYTKLITDRDLKTTDPTIAIGAAQAAQQTILQDNAVRAQYALEQEAVKRVQDIAATGDPVQARMLLNNMEYGDANQIIRDMNAKQLILEREINKIQANKEGDWLGSAAHFLLSVLPLYGSTAGGGNVDIEQGLKHWYDWMFSGQRRQVESNTLWNIPIQDFSDYVEKHLIPTIQDKSSFLGFHDKTKQLDTLSHLSRPSAVWVANTWDTVDNLGWIGPAEFMKATSIPGMMIRNGAKKETKNLLAQAAIDMTHNSGEAATLKSGIDGVEVVDHMLPDAVNPATTHFTRDGEPVRVTDTPDVNGRVWVDHLTDSLDNIAGKHVYDMDELTARVLPDNVEKPKLVVPETEAASSVVSVQAGVNNIVAQTSDLMEQFQALSQLGRLTDEEAARAAKAIEDRYVKDAEEVGENLDVAVTKEKLSDGTELQRVEFTRGEFETLEEAEKFGMDLFPGEGSVVRDESGQYSFRISKHVPETGFYSEIKPEATGFLSRVLLSSRAVGDRLLANLGQAGGNTRAKLLKTFATEYAKQFSSLRRAEREALAQVLQLGEKNAAWYTPDQIELLYDRAFKRPPTQAELDAYNTAKNLNDIEYMLRNDEVYKQKAVAGFEAVTFDRPAGRMTKGNARVVNDWQTIPEDRIYNVTEGRSYSKVTPMTQEEKTRLKGEGYVLLHLDQEIKMTDGTVTKAVLSKKSDLTIEPLEREQIAYRAGGHRIYQGKYFAKQARIGTQPDGEKFLVNPSTFITGQTKAEVGYWVRQMEQARKLFKAGAPDVAMKQALPQNVTLEKFLAGMADGTFDPDHEFRVMFDRETMPEYINTVGYADLRNQEETEVESYLRTNGRMFYGHKGQQLTDWQGSLATTLDPFQTINKALMNVANLSSFSDYKITAAERWHKTYGGYLGQKGMNPIKAVRDGTFGIETPEAIRQAGEAQRAIIKRTLGWKTEFDRQQEIYARRFAEWVGGDDPYSLRSKVASGVSNWFDTNNPVQALRGLAFDLKLGLFNVAQFPLQIGTLAAATTMSPKFGFQGMVNLFPLRAYLSKSGTEHMLDTLIDRGVHKTVGMEASEYKAMMRYAKQSGFFDIGGTHQLIAEGGPNAAVGAFKHIDNFRHATRFWFNEGEVWNRAVAWRIAWGETSEKFPGLAVGSADFKAEVAGRAEEFAFSMSEQSSAAWQKGITSIPTQFWAYNARMLEAMLGKTFTPAQRARLVIGQTLLYGSAGLPLAGAVSDKIKASSGQVPPINSAWGFVDRGLMDTVVYHMTGQDLLVSKRFGTGNFISDTIKDIFGMSAYGEKSVADMMGGATASITAAGFETILDVVKYMAHESGGEPTRPLTEDAILRFAKNISTVSNLNKAYMVANYGELISGKGTVMAANLPSQTAFAVALGISPGTSDGVTAAMAYLKNNKEAVEEASKTINNYRTRMVNEPGNRDEINQEINMYVKLLPPDIRAQALRKAHGRMSPSLLDSITLQAEKNRIRAESFKSMEEPN